MPRVKGTFLEKLDQGPVICDGGFVFALEKRGYVTAGPWTPEAVIEHPEAVKQIHREFVRAGSDVNQAFTFYASEDKLNNRGNKAGRHGVYNINKAACEVVREVVEQDSDGYGLVAGGLSQTPTYLTTLDKEKVKEEVKKQLVVFKEQKVDLMICEYYEHVEECEWHIEAVKEFMPGVAICASMAINEFTDVAGVETGECGLRLVKAGADVVGINCHFGPFRCIEAVKKMKAAVEAAGLKAHYMIQPLGYHTPDAGVQGFIDLPEFPFGLEPRIITRWDAARYARESYEAGIRFIGGCCGFEPYHIRAVSEELSKERSGYLPANSLHGAKCLEIHTKPWVRDRASQKYWTSLNPSTGRPFSAAFSKPASWGISAGHELVKQHTSATTEKELEAGRNFKEKK